MIITYMFHGKRRYFVILFLWCIYSQTYLNKMRTNKVKLNIYFGIIEFIPTIVGDKQYLSRIKVITNLGCQTIFYRVHYCIYYFHSKDM